jgi:hypothetical protein
MLENEIGIPLLLAFLLLITVARLVYSWHAGLRDAWLGGWASLAERYPLEGTFRGHEWAPRIARFGRMGSANTFVTIGADRQGLHLATWPSFARGHCPLFIPWEDVTKGARRWQDYSMITLCIGADRGIKVLVTEDLVPRIEAATGHEIPAAPEV